MERHPVKPFKGKSREVMILLRRRIYSLYGVVGCLMWKCSNRPDAVRCKQTVPGKGMCWEVARHRKRDEPCRGRSWRKTFANVATLRRIRSEEVVMVRDSSPRVKPRSSSCDDGETATADTFGGDAARASRSSCQGYGAMGCGHLS
jgi:hypothetical protein